MTDLIAQYSDHIGIIGVLLTLLAYGALSLGRMSSDALSYSVLNFIGSLLILVSLMYSWNLSSVIIEAAWIVISVIGLYRFFVSRRERKHKRKEVPKNLYAFKTNSKA